MCAPEGMLGTLRQEIAQGDLDAGTPHSPSSAFSPYKRSLRLRQKQRARLRVPAANHQVAIGRACMAPLTLLHRVRNEGLVGGILRLPAPSARLRVAPAVFHHQHGNLPLARHIHPVHIFGFVKHKDNLASIGVGSGVLAIGTRRRGVGVNVMHAASCAEKGMLLAVMTPVVIWVQLRQPFGKRLGTGAFAC